MSFLNKKNKVNSNINKMRKNFNDEEGYTNNEENDLDFEYGREERFKEEKNN